jgi:hypothetical protein
MARKKKSLPAAKRPVYYSRKSYARPKWMRFVRIISMIIVVIVLVLAMIGIVIRYYRMVTKH